MKIFNLENKIILITGALGGIGTAIVELFLSQNAQVIMTDINQKLLENRQHEYLSQGYSVDIFCADLSQDQNIENLSQFINEKYSKIDSVIFCNGIEGNTPSLINLNYFDVQKILDVNLLSALKISDLAIQIMKKNGSGGSLIYISSIASIRGNKSLGLYGISKSALNQLARNIAVEFGPINIRANSISPGLIETPLAKKLMENKAFMEKRLLATPLRRVGQPHEISSIALLLASEAGSFITGQNIVVDGGTTISDGN
ncbi:SDR family oxidoreductase [Acinetobacter sichuanensis]|uniref:SDR family NAD(P)-dependent oxidoreductase n=1 Tax=Acinetobacter sichuanensis TaxID=2136183 RepID=UPI0028105B14|nr:SDR family oxidoreductase [Acinetobacter sichuanensis]MDQ9021871.1 SDR family oxidoreductase [Acinetobacter sichuanensis]